MAKKKTTNTTKTVKAVAVEESKSKTTPVVEQPKIENTKKVEEQEEKWLFLTKPVEQILSKGGNIWTVVIAGKKVKVNKQMLKKVQ